MAQRRFGIIALLLCLCLCAAICPVQAASTSDATQPIATDKDTTLTIAYGNGETAFAELPIGLYHVADVSADFQYTLTAPFESSHLELNGVASAGEWNVIRFTLEAHILANQISPTRSVTTDAAGNACFDALKPGLYYVTVAQAVQEDTTYLFDSALIALPGLGVDGLWQYAVTATAKYEILPPVQPDETIEYGVLKLWKGDGKNENRPSSVEIEIFRDGVSQQVVTLSEKNHWSYTWTAAADNAVWMVVERNVPAGYAATVERREGDFVVTNTLIPDSMSFTGSPPLSAGTFTIVTHIPEDCKRVGGLFTIRFAE